MSLIRGTHQMLAAVACLGVLVVAVLLLGGCGHEPGTYSGAGQAWTVCGTTLNESAEGVVPIDATQPGTRQITSSTAGGLALLLEHGCHHGAAFRVLPSSAAAVWERSGAGGGTAALMLRPTADQFVVQITHHDGTTTTLDVDLSVTKDQ